MGLSWLQLILLPLLFLTLFQAPALALKKPYIVYMGGHSHGPYVTEADFRRVTENHVQLLGSFVGSTENAKEAMLYSYTKSINGFAAMLEEEVAESLRNHPKVASVFLSQKLKLHTSHSWEFLGLSKNGKIPSHSLWKKANFGDDVIIANMDSGVWPEDPSFNDDGMGPIPTKWKGKCQNNTKEGVPCNRKLIGASYYQEAYASDVRALNLTVPASETSARDLNGHGSHTLSTAGGSIVPNANILGIANGTTKGGSPKARLAAYKVCWDGVTDAAGCHTMDIMAGFDDAIHDGVDVISVSLGGDALDYYYDGMSVAAFHALKKGIVVVTSAGNDGPSVSTVANVSPWMITVAASTTDRDLTARVDLGNNVSLKGESCSPDKLPVKYYPLISSADAKAASSSLQDASLCKSGSLDPEKVKGKILVCMRGETSRMGKGMVAFQAGAVGMILCNEELSGNSLNADVHYIPVAHLSYNDGLSVFKYLNSTKSPTAYISPVKNEINIKPAPVMASFSSRGPSLIVPEILKPDITAPGVDIIAAYSQAMSPTELPDDERRVSFVTMTGTSMSCPHISGIAALLKGLHPDWSPSAIKSAIMTSGRIQDNEKEAVLDSSFNRATPMSYGAGHVSPNRAADPGLVYDLTTSDYLNFLCALGYNEIQIQAFSDDPFQCPENFNILDFNYPSITVPNLQGSVTVTRTLKNVGTPGTYHARLYHPMGIEVSVEPSVLEFTKMGEEKAFKVTLMARSPRAASDYVFGKLTWIDTEHRHYVRTPLTVKVAEEN